MGYPKGGVVYRIGRYDSIKGLSSCTLRLCGSRFFKKKTLLPSWFKKILIVPFPLSLFLTLQDCINHPFQISLGHGRSGWQAKPPVEQIFCYRAANNSRWTTLLTGRLSSKYRLQVPEK
jgi:hypothetical protein